MSAHFIQNYDKLNSNPHREIVLEMIEKAFAAVSPQEVLKKDFTLDGDILTIQKKKHDLSKYKRIFVVGFGKGSAGNAKVVEDVLGSKLTKGYVNDVVDDVHFKKLVYTKGTHPLPSQANFDFTNTVIKQLQDTTEDDLVIVITCGGGSVLFEAPNMLSLAQMTEVNKALLKSGANITEMNVIRKHLSRVKGGGFAKIVHPATVVNLIFSDVPGNDLSVIASGPLVKNHSTMADVRRIQKKYELDTKVTIDPKAFSATPTDPKYYKKVSNLLIVSNHNALTAMEKYAAEKGIAVHVMTDRLQGDAHKLGKQLIDEALPGEILLAAGESTIKVKGKGKGGRNQALVLSALKHITGETVLASFGTDGWDFYKLAGAIADKDTKYKMKHLGIKAEPFIKDDNSYEFWTIMHDGINTGHLNSNVADLYIVYKP